MDNRIRRRWFQSFALALISLTAAVTVVAAPNQISVGGTRLAIPTPNGYAPVTPAMKVLNRFLDNLVPPNNKRFLTFIPQTEVQRALKDEIPNLERTLNVQVSRRIENAKLSQANFAQVKTLLRQENNKIFEQVRRGLPTSTNRINQATENQFNVNSALQISNIIPLEPHEESARTMAFSLLAKVNATGENGQRISDTIAGTATLVYVRQKFLFLYCYGGEKDLQWTRTASKNWTAAVLAAN
ncbi:hypothetical protein H6F43_05025 [Leptolyngbya sp. FACHB-36]|uniref:hypothetical protein n=1 Tax=Leptolyngbya sp. FACHB-36 TaxID=2692808 RepID=UPI0016818215|nr:hypothetical protein [Leptolyngbya sp. FACHB-36]MBD2019547.1 hypothetical protein [Leptolyngbya sp. FACHB-36]